MHCHPNHFSILKKYTLSNPTLLPDKVGDVYGVVISSMVVAFSVAVDFSVFVSSVAVDFSVFTIPLIVVSIKILLVIVTIKFKMLRGEIYLR